MMTDSFPSLVFLTGLAGSGKTTIGLLLARSLRLELIDVDQCVEARLRQPVREVFLRGGERAFRLAERELLETVSAGGPAVVALGAGSILDPDILALVRQSGVLVYLRTDPALVWERIKGTAKATLLYRPDEAPTGFSDQEAHLRLETLLKIRETGYLSAHVVVDTDRKAPSQVAEAVEWELRKWYLRQDGGGAAAPCR